MTGERVLVVLTALVFVGGCGSGDTGTEKLEADTTGQVPLVDTETLKLHLEGQEPPLLLDVRTPGEFAEGHLRGATLMPSYSVAARLKELESYKDKPIVVYCEVGVRSLRVSKLLLSKGFNHVLHYQGGMRAWMKSGGEVVKS